MNDSPAAPAVEKIDVEAVNKKAARSLYKKRVKVHPKRVNGRFRSTPRIANR